MRFLLPRASGANPDQGNSDPTSFREHLEPRAALVANRGVGYRDFPPTPYITGMSAGRYVLVRGFQRVPQISLITVHSPGVRWPM